MSRIWFYLWIALLVTQMLTLWLTQRPSLQAMPAEDVMEAELLSLAGMTNKAWAQLMPEDQPEGIKDAVPAGKELLVREALTLELLDIEQALGRTGADIQVADDFQEWISSSAGMNGGRDGTGLQACRFLGDLVEWIHPFLGDDCAVSLRRLNLHPAASSAFPSLAFEMTGPPANMGRGLLLLEQAADQWRLMEMDLLRQEDSTDWWIRGSFTFSTDPSQ